MKNLHENSAVAFPDLVLAAATAFTTAANTVDLTQYNEVLIVLQLNQAGAGTAVQLVRRIRREGACLYGILQERSWRHYLGFDSRRGFYLDDRWPYYWSEYLPVPRSC